MPANLTESSTFTSTVSVPVNGDARTVSSVTTAFQALANRTKKLRDWMLLLDANQDGAVDAKLRPSAGTATAGTAPIKLTSGTLNTKEETGALEFASKTLYFTPDATRLSVSLSDHTHALIHAQATDTGTTQTSFAVASGATRSHSRLVTSSLTTTTSGVSYLLPQLSVVDNSCMTFSLLVTGRARSSGCCGSFKIEGAVKRGSGAGTVTITSDAVTTLLAESVGGGVSMDCIVTSSTPSGGLDIGVTPSTSASTDWIMFGEVAEVRAI